jgi:hypothetical protein
MAESTETAGAVDEWAAATAAEAARVAAEEATNDHVNAVRAEMRAAYNDSDAGVAAAQHREAARIMSLPTPHALDEIGSVVGDPTLGPAS